MFRQKQPIYYFALTREIGRAGAAQGINCKFSPFVVAGVYVALFACNRLQGWPAMIGLLAPLALLPVQQYVNSLNTGSPTPINSRFAIVNWVGIVIGTAIQIFNVI